MAGSVQDRLVLMDESKTCFQIISMDRPLKSRVVQLVEASDEGERGVSIEDGWLLLVNENLLVISATSLLDGDDDRVGTHVIERERGGYLHSLDDDAEDKEALMYGGIRPWKIVETSLAETRFLTPGVELQPRDHRFSWLEDPERSIVLLADSAQVVSADGGALPRLHSKRGHLLEHTLTAVVDSRTSQRTTTEPSLWQRLDDSDGRQGSALFHVRDRHSIGDSCLVLVAFVPGLRPYWYRLSYSQVLNKMRPQRLAEFSHSLRTDEIHQFKEATADYLSWAESSCVIYVGFLRELVSFLAEEETS